MLLRIFLILAILAGLGSGGVAYYEWATQIPTLTKQRDSEHELKVSEITAHNKTKGELKKTKADLVQTQTELTDTKADLGKAVAKADAQEKRAADLSDKLAKANGDLQEAQNLVAEYKASDLTPEQVVKLNKNYKDALFQIQAINGEKGVLQRQLVSVKAQLDKFIGEDHTVKLRSNLKGAIVAVDPKWDFVVLNIGEDDGAIVEGEMLVSRNGKLVAKVVIHSVEKGRSIANIIPGWKLGEVIEGDVVTPAHPASS